MQTVRIISDWIKRYLLYCIIIIHLFCCAKNYWGNLIVIWRRDEIFTIEKNPNILPELPCDICALKSSQSNTTTIVRIIFSPAMTSYENVAFQVSIKNQFCTKSQISRASLNVLHVQPSLTWNKATLQY